MASSIELLARNGVKSTTLRNNSAASLPVESTRGILSPVNVETKARGFFLGRFVKRGRLPKLPRGDILREEATERRSHEATKGNRTGR